VGCKFHGFLGRVVQQPDYSRLAFEGRRRDWCSAGIGEHAGDGIANFRR
jgi:hypothetical protein